MSNPFLNPDGTPRPIGELSRVCGQFRDGTTGHVGDNLRFHAMDLCEALMRHHDRTRDNLMRETLRSWVGRTQRAAGLQE